MQDHVNSRTCGRVECWNKQETLGLRDGCHYANEVSQGNPRNMT